MDEFSSKMEQLAPSFWRATLVNMPRNLASKIDENPGDEKAIRLSFAPGYNGDPLRISLRPNVPKLMTDLTRELVERELKQMEARVRSDWMVKHLMPVLGWFIRIPKEDRQPESIVQDIVKKERDRRESLIPQESAQLWMSYAANALLKTALLSTHSALESLALDEPIAPLLVEGNGKIMYVSLEGLTHPPSTPDLEQPIVAPSGRITLQV